MHPQTSFVRVLLALILLSMGLGAPSAWSGSLAMQHDIQAVVPDAHCPEAGSSQSSQSVNQSADRHAGKPAPDHGLGGHEMAGHDLPEDSDPRSGCCDPQSCHCACPTAGVAVGLDVAAVLPDAEAPAARSSLRAPAPAPARLLRPPIR